MEYSTLKIKTAESEYHWCLRIPQGKLIKDNINDFGTIDSGAFQFRKGLLGGLEHSMNVSLTGTYATVNLKIYRPSAEKYTVQLGKMELISGTGVQHCTEFDLVMKYIESLCYHLGSASAAYSSLETWEDAINIIRISFRIESVERAKITFHENGNNSPPGNTTGTRPNCLADISSLELFLLQKPDLTVICGAEEYLVHKSVLADRSSVFRQMFAHEMKETSSGKLELNEKEISPTSVLQFIRFLYTGNMDVNKNVCMELFAAAEKYDIGDLKSRCELYLAEHVTEEDAAELYYTAELHNGMFLKDTAFSFLKRQKGEMFKDSASWKDFVNTFPELSFRLLLE